MGWLKKIISVTIGKVILRPVIPLIARSFSLIQKKDPHLYVAGKDANPKEVASMKQKEAVVKAEEVEQKKAKDELKLVISGAKIQCTLCSNPMGTLIATHNTPTIQGMPAAIATDKGKLNLLFAGSCLKVPNTPVPCPSVIKPGSWKNMGSFKMQDESPLLLKSTIKCFYGGVDIKITDCGQKTIFAYDAPTAMESDTDENSQMRIALFFDGTRNNMKNTEAREEYLKSQDKDPEIVAGADPVKAKFYSDLGNKKDDSYENGYSNVAFLSKEYIREDQDPENLRDYVYIEGIATGDYEHDAYVKDSMMGYAFAKGETGIAVKVDKGCEAAAKKIQKLIVDGKKVSQITIDVFGFSRGAAAARSFLNEVKQKGAAARTQTTHSPAGTFISEIAAIPPFGKLGTELDLLDVDLTDTHIVIRFAGLFDTVSSYGICFKKEKDTEIFGLDAVSISKHALHLVSADEHRYFFPLVNIKSAGFNEKIFPGVHSDVGGSYVDGRPENVKGLAISTKEYVHRRYQKVLSEGWYTTDQLKIVRPKFFQLPQAEKILPYDKEFLEHAVDLIEEQTLRLRGEKTSIPVAYSYIPLHIMCDYAMQDGIYIKFRDVKLKRKLNIDAYEELKEVRERLYNVVFHDYPELLFYSRAELEDQIEDFRPGGRRFLSHHVDLGLDGDEVPININWGKPMEIESFVTDPDLIQKIKDHNTILMLRGKHLHRSADWFEPGFNPTKYELRTIWNG